LNEMQHEGDVIQVFSFDCCPIEVGQRFDGKSSEDLAHFLSLARRDFVYCGRSSTSERSEPNIDQCRPENSCFCVLGHQKWFDFKQ